MVQVDVFWGYGFGASLAAAAGTALPRREQPYESRYFTTTVLFLSLCWAPTGMLLLLRHPSWETMQAADNLAALSEWLVLAFGMTNVTQGILGFWVGHWLLSRQRTYAVQLNWIAGYFAMFFILLYGWDGLGYDRFLYDRDMLPGAPAWTPGVATAGGVAAAFLRFLRSGVAGTLYLDGMYLLPPFFYLVARWIREDARCRELAVVPSSTQIVLRYLGGVFVVGLLCAAFSALSVRGVGYLLGVGEHVARGRGEVPAHTARHVLSYVLGLPLSLWLLWRAVLRPGGVVHRYLAPLMTA